MSAEKNIHCPYGPGSVQCLIAVLRQKTPDLCQECGWRDLIPIVEVLLQRDSLRLLEKRIELLEKTLRILAATSDSEHAEEEK